MKYIKPPRYMKITTKGTIKIKRWGWGWVAFTHVRPERWRDYPVWFVMCLWITIKGLAGKIDD